MTVLAATEYGYWIKLDGLVAFRTTWAWLNLSDWPIPRHGRTAYQPG